MAAAGKKQTRTSYANRPQCAKINKTIGAVGRTVPSGKGEDIVFESYTVNTWTFINRIFPVCCFFCGPWNQFLFYMALFRRRCNYFVNSVKERNLAEMSAALVPQNVCCGGVRFGTFVCDCGGVYYQRFFTERAAGA